MKFMAKGSDKRFWLCFGLVLIMAFMSAGPLFAATALSPAEKKSLLFMREEEKLARDVYTTLYDKWGLAVFNNITRSEQTHMNAIKTLLDRYGLPDPVQSPGVFTNPDLQALYDTLIEDGRTSIAAAIQVGVSIEEKEIADLAAGLKISTHRDITKVYTNLKAASQNHLKAFKSYQ